MSGIQKHPIAKPEIDWLMAEFFGAVSFDEGQQPHYERLHHVFIESGLLIKNSAAYQRFVANRRSGFATDFVLDSIVLPSPYALSFGGFVSLHTSLWFGAGGIVSSALNSLPKAKTEDDIEVPEDMSASSLFGGGLIAGDALAALGLGLVGLAATLLTG